MLRRRIFASAMASVMALGSVAVVASAETNAVTSNVKSKADLEAFVAQVEGLKLDDFGSISTERLQGALDYAENVLAAEDSTVDDYTVAYAMVEATYNKLKIYSAEELAALIASCKKDYESENIYNPELGDPIFDETAYENFVLAYEDAESVLNSNDSRVITDAYEVLEAASQMARKDVVTKSQFRSALKAYEAMLQKEYAYDPWRIGSVGGWENIDTGNYWVYQQSPYAYGALYEHLAAGVDAINSAYAQMDEIKSLSKTSLPEIVQACRAAEDAVKVMNNFVADDTTRASKASVTRLLNQYHGRLVRDYVTTEAEDLFAAVIAAVGADKVSVEIDYNAGTGSVATKSVKYNSADYASRIHDMWTIEDTWVSATPNGMYYTGTMKMISAGIKIKSETAFYIPLDEDGQYWVPGTAITTEKPSGKYKMITKNVTADLTDYIKVDAGDIDPDVSITDNADYNSVSDGDVGSPVGLCWGSEGVRTAYTTTAPDVIAYKNSAGEDVSARTDLQTAFELVDLYFGTDKNAIAADSNPIYALDTVGAVAKGTAKGSSAEWAIVYRYLKYALSDKYDAVAEATYTKANVNELIEKAYELAELTGDAALFSVNHNALVEMRQAALDWMKAANKDKKYKDNVTSCEVTLPDESTVYYTSTAMYKALEGSYNNLLNDYNAFMYSFEEIYNKISDVKGMIDDGDLQANDTLLNALEETAYRLSIVESFEEKYPIENDAFTSDRYFQGFNRVFTKGESYTLKVLGAGDVSIAYWDSLTLSHNSLKEAYENLLAEVKKQTDPEGLLGDVNGDGAVNALDAMAILEACAAGTNGDIAKEKGDYNGDGSVNSLDAQKILADRASGVI